MWMTESEDREREREEKRDARRHAGSSVLIE